jgi:hypothetical protein
MPTTARPSALGSISRSQGVGTGVGVREELGSRLVQPILRLDAGKVVLEEVFQDRAIILFGVPFFRRANKPHGGGRETGPDFLCVGTLRVCWGFKGMPGLPLNRVLLARPPDDLARLMPDLELVSCQRGTFSSTSMVRFITSSFQIAASFPSLRFMRTATSLRWRRLVERAAPAFELSSARRFPR